MKRVLTFLFLGVFIFSGCGANKDLLKEDKSRKDAEILIESAKAAIVEARQAGAEKYAKELLASSEAELAAAKNSLEKNETQTAVTFAGNSLKDARVAKGKSLAAAALEKAAAEINLAKAAGAEKNAPVLLDNANKDFAEAQKKNTAKEFDAVLEPAQKAYEEAAEAVRLCGLIGKAENSIAEAKKDVEAAVKADAKKYAPGAVKSAEDNLFKALTAFADKDYIKAIDYAGKLSDDAKAAKSACVAAAIGKYTVKSGDNLWNIAKDKKVLDDPFLWPIIYKNNLEKIKNPDLIFPAQEFELPVNLDDKIKRDAMEDAIKYKSNK